MFGDSLHFFFWNCLDNRGILIDIAEHLANKGQQFMLKKIIVLVLRR